MSVTNKPEDSIPRPFDDLWLGPSMIVIGIHIGVLHSTVSFAFLQSGAKRSIRTVTQWPGRESQDHSGRIPTAIWYDSANKAVSFGSEALTPQIEEKAKENGWKPVKYFTVHLHPPHLAAQHDQKPDPLPFTVPLNQVYSDFLEYLLQCTQSYFENHIIDGKRIWKQFQPIIQVVLTLNRGYGNREKAFLRLAVIKAGFANANDAATRVHFVYEAEATVRSYIIHSEVESKLLVPDSIFILCSAGRSKVETTLYSIKSANPIRIEETCAPKYVKAGGLYVDVAAERYLRKMLKDAGLSPEKIEEYVTRGVNNFKLKLKRAFKDPTMDQSIEIAGTRYNNTAIRARRGRITLRGAEVKRFFDPCVDKILESINSQLQRNPVTHIVLVGGFGASPYLRERLKQRFGPVGCDIVTPRQPRPTAVAEGAISWYLSNNDAKRIS
ncbi:hypothetical protein RSOLAG22IIIB_08263 [Rhizoctonia solani]|uniref:Uncharacterized protein n=1 Tax=Rhizoctonia solani TaxID=456999 RepID=A0A0K6FS33_9AGAM|nr:hypothetical protein RSOLAG22IIIB_08263 [Rhizoctonia solani]